MVAVCRNRLGLLQVSRRVAAGISAVHGGGRFRGSGSTLKLGTLDVRRGGLAVPAKISERVRHAKVRLGVARILPCGPFKVRQRVLVVPLSCQGGGQALAGVPVAGRRLKRQGKGPGGGLPVAGRQERPSCEMLCARIAVRPVQCAKVGHLTVPPQGGKRLEQGQSRGHAFGIRLEVEPEVADGALVVAEGLQGQAQVPAHVGPFRRDLGGLGERLGRLCMVADFFHDQAVLDMRLYAAGIGPCRLPIALRSLGVPPQLGKGFAPAEVHVCRVGIQPRGLVEPLHGALVVADGGKGQPGAQVRGGVVGIEAYGLGVCAARVSIFAERGQRVGPLASHVGIARIHLGDYVVFAQRAPVVPHRGQDGGLQAAGFHGGPLAHGLANVPKRSVVVAGLCQ